MSLFKRNCGCKDNQFNQRPFGMDMGMNMNMNYGMGPNFDPGMGSGCPIVEPGINKVVTQDCVHEVPQEW